MKKEWLEKVLNAHKNLMIEGDVATGKTTNILFPIVENAIDKKESLFILDPREEYLNRYYDKLKANNYNIIIINLRDVDKSEGWNPLEYPYNLFKNGNEDKAQDYLEKIGKTIFYENTNSDPFWSTTAADFFTGVTLGLFEDGKEDEVNLNSVNGMFNGVDKRFGATDYITEYFTAKGVTSKPYIFASTTFLAPVDTKGSILSVARQKLRLLVSREKLSQLMSKTTFSFEEVVNKPTAIIFIARDENKIFNSLASMFIEQLYAILVDLKTKNKFHLVLDNFDIIEKCNDLVDILSSCISRNIKTYIATRSVPELSKIYGSYMLKLCDLVSIGNTNIKVVINNVEETTEKEFETIAFTESNVEYPKLNTSVVKLFDLNQFVKDLKAQQLGNMNFSKTEFGDPFKVDALIKSIDDKIAQLDIKEQMIKSNQKNKVDPFKMDHSKNNLDKLTRKELANRFYGYHSKEKIDNSELAINYLNEIQNYLKNYNYDSDPDFIMVGRKKYIYDEIIDIVNGNKSVDNPLYFILGSLEEFMCVQNQIYLENDTKELREKNDRYSNKGIICLEEKEYINKIIEEIKNYIKSLEDDNMTLFSKKHEIPDSMQKQGDKEEKIKNEKTIFSAFEGGYFGPSYYYFVNNYKDHYEFRFGYSKDGRIVNNDENDPNIHIFEQNGEYYKKFIEELLSEIKYWNETYNNPNAVDGTQWNIKLIEQNREYSGSNAFPQNYNKVVEILKRYFNVDYFVKDNEENNSQTF